MSLNDAKLLVGDASHLLAEIERGYQESLVQKTIPPTLHVRIKQFIDNTRSALDYAAFTIFVKFCASTVTERERRAIERRLYFPIKPNQAVFDASMDADFPGLRQKEPQIIAILQDLQPFTATSPWLQRLADLSNENKHRHLSPQTRAETREVRVTGPGGSVSFNPAAVTFGPGVFINGVPVDPRTQLPVPSAINKVEIITWVGFTFTDLGTDVLETLRGILKGVEAAILAMDPLV